MFFEGITSIEELKKMYRKLAMQFHPDIKGGSVEKMSAINAEYDTAFKIIAKKSSSEYKSENENINAESVDDGFKDIISKLIILKGIEIEICGKWLWISGDTRANKDKLKEADCRWASKKKLWYWHPADINFKHGRKKTKSMDYIRTVYGSQTINDESKHNKRRISA